MHSQLLSCIVWWYLQSHVYIEYFRYCECTWSLIFMIFCCQCYLQLLSNILWFFFFWIFSSYSSHVMSWCCSYLAIILFVNFNSKICLSSISLSVFIALNKLLIVTLLIAYILSVSLILYSSLLCFFWLFLFSCVVWSWCYFLLFFF